MGGGFATVATAPGVGILANDTKSNWCTGTLVGPRHVLTANHCAGLNNFQYGYDALYNKTPTTYNVTAFYAIPDTHDTALAVLNADVSGGTVRAMRSIDDVDSRTPIGVKTSGYPVGLGKDGQQITVGGMAVVDSRTGMLTVRYEHGGGMSGAAVTYGGDIIAVHQAGHPSPKVQDTTAEGLSSATVQIIEKVISG